jgi:hypothetical protein
MSLFLFVSRSLSLFLSFSLDFNFAGAQESALFLFIVVSLWAGGPNQD